MRGIIYLVTLVILAGMPRLAAAQPSREASDHPRPGPVEQPSPKALQTSIDRGVAFLLEFQNKDGSWGNARKTKDLNIYAPVPGAHDGFRAAVTALCIAALIETGGNEPKVIRSLERGEQWLLDNLPDVKRANSVAIYNVWAHGYSIQALIRMYQRLPEDVTRREQIKATIRQQFNMLSRYESIDGGWGYYDFRAGTRRPSSDSTSFTNGAILVALKEAQQIGVEPPAKVVKRAIDSTVRQRNPDFSYLYGEYLKYRPRGGINRPGGSLGRSQCCNIALRMWDDPKITDEVLKVWLDRLITRNGWLSIGRKRPIPHESYFQVAGYFYYFGHYYAGLCIEALPKEDQSFYQDHLARIIMPLQEKDGSWWDYPLYNYHQPYGTAFALMTLKRCQR